MCLPHERRAAILCGRCRMPAASEKPRSDARVAEGAPLLREYRVKSSIEGSNPSLSASFATPRDSRGIPSNVMRTVRCDRRQCARARAWLRALPSRRDCAAGSRCSRGALQTVQCETCAASRGTALRNLEERRRAPHGLSARTGSRFPPARRGVAHRSPSGRSRSESDRRGPASIVIRTAQPVSPFLDGAGIAALLG